MWERGEEEWEGAGWGGLWACVQEPGPAPALFVASQVPADVPQSLSALLT